MGRLANPARVHLGVSYRFCAHVVGTRTNSCLPLVFRALGGCERQANLERPENSAVWIRGAKKNPFCPGLPA